MREEQLEALKRVVKEIKGKSKRVSEKDISLLDGLISFEDKQLKSWKKI